MGWELLVGLRYLRSRRKERFVSVITVISTLSVVLGVMVLTIVLSVMTGFEEDLRARVLGLNPHIRIEDRLGGLLRHPEDIVAVAREEPHVVAAAPVVAAQVLVAANGRMFGVYLHGVQPDRTSGVHGIARFVVEGDAGQLAQRVEVGGARLPSLMIGRELARRLGVRRGERVSLMVPALAASPLGLLPRSRRFVVVALYDSGMVEYDAGLVYCSIDDARALLGLGRAATGVEAVLDDPYAAPAVAESLSEKLGLPYWVRSWTEVHRNVFQALRLEKTVYFLVLLLIILVAAFTIVATLYMVVLEKHRDIAVLKAMGATDQSIAAIFVAKGLLIGILGTACGALAGYGICEALDRYHLIGLPEGVFYVSTLPVRIVPSNFLLVSAASVLICLAACIFPAWKAARVVPVDVLRYE
ncbi:MAG: ABC transporter permease [Candidatus Dadabacteria bacterium]|nr:MAG: ABC transporter permease [Candidatus Dadabacteria bacterium]